MERIELKNKTIFVTGAAGFIGSNLVLIRVFNKTLKSVLLGRRIAASGHCR